MGEENKSPTLHFYFVLIKLGIIEYSYFVDNSNELIQRMLYLEAKNRFDNYID